MTEVALLRDFLRTSLSAFVEKTFHELEPGTPYRHNWYIDHLCWQLERVARGDMRRLIINVPPRSMKSITVSVGFAAWLMGKDPTKRIMAVSYAEDLARKLSLDTRTVMQSVWFGRTFPNFAFAATKPRTLELKTAQQYQQNPLPLEGNIVKREWLRSYEEAPARFDFVVASWDTASTLAETSDWSVGTVWGTRGLDFYLLDRVRGRFEVPELRREIVGLATRWNVDQTVIEKGDIGRAVQQDLRRTGEPNLILRTPRYDKVSRFLTQSARFESRQVHVPSGASWYAEWLNELLAFPNGKHDDQVDSTSQALEYLTWRTSSLNERRESDGPTRASKRPSSSPRPRGQSFSARR